jgi:hypothetical protein
MRKEKNSTRKTPNIEAMAMADVHGYSPQVPERQVLLKLSNEGANRWMKLSDDERGSPRENAHARRRNDDSGTKVLGEFEGEGRHMQALIATREDGEQSTKSTTGQHSI